MACSERVRTEVSQRRFTGPQLLLTGQRSVSQVLKQGGIGRVVDALRVHRTTDDNDGATTRRCRSASFATWAHTVVATVTELLSVACKLIGTILDDLDLDAVLAEKGSAEASGAAEYSSSEESKARVRRMAKQRKTLGPEQITNDLRLAIDGIAGKTAALTVTAHKRRDLTREPRGSTEAMRRHKANPDVNRWALYALLVGSAAPLSLTNLRAHALRASCSDHCLEASEVRPRAARRARRARRHLWRVACVWRRSGGAPMRRDGHRCPFAGRLEPADSCHGGGVYARCRGYVAPHGSGCDDMQMLTHSHRVCGVPRAGLVKRYGTADPQVDLFGSKILAIQKQMASLAHSAAGLGVGEEGVRVLAAEAAQKGKARARKPSARATKAAAATAAASGSRGVEVVELDGAEEQKRD